MKLSRLSEEQETKLMDAANALWPDVITNNVILIADGMGPEGELMVGWWGSDMHPVTFTGLLNWVNKRTLHAFNQAYDRLESDGDG